MFGLKIVLIFTRFFNVKICATVPQVHVYMYTLLIGTVRMCFLYGRVQGITNFVCTPRIPIIVCGKTSFVDFMSNSGILADDNK